MSSFGESKLESVPKTNNDPKISPNLLLGYFFNPIINLLISPK